MLVLGIANNDGAGACLVRDGEILAAAGEERFTRVKEHRTWPERAIAFVLGHGGASLSDVDVVAYGWNAGFDGDKHLLAYVDRIAEEARNRPEGIPHIRRRISDELHNDKEKRAEFDAWVDENSLRGRVLYVDHHDCHAIGAFACSPFDEALVVTCDGRGDFQSLTVRVVSGDGPGGERVLQRETSVDSLGYFYGRITKLLGYTPNRHEGKITGLAARGDETALLPLMRRMIDLDAAGRLRAHTGELYQPSYHGYSDTLTDLIDRADPADVAAAAQAHVENLLTAIVARHVERTGVTRVCLAGGVFGNVKLNQRIREAPGVTGVHVLPPMGDAGLPLQAAVTAAFRAGHRSRVPSMALGPDSTIDADGLRAVTSACPGLEQETFDDPFPVVLRALEAGRVVGVHRGRMEFGPRALGRRSILYRADDATVNDWLNERLSRTEFMPFAPMTAEEQAPSCYVGWDPDQATARFMTITYDCTESFQKLCPAVVHVDGTARPQIVRAQDDPALHRLLTDWHERTGHPALVNTSFNRHEEPIVCSAADSVAAVAEGIVDVLLVDDRHLVWDGARLDRAHLLD